MREIRQSGSEGGEPQSNAACLPLSLVHSNLPLALETFLSHTGRCADSPARHK